MDLRLSKAYWFFSLAYYISHKILHFRLSINGVHHQFIDQLWSHNFTYVLWKMGIEKWKSTVKNHNNQYNHRFRANIGWLTNWKAREGNIFLTITAHDAQDSENTGFHTSSFYSPAWSIILATFLVYRILCKIFLFTMLMNVWYTPS